MFTNAADWPWKTCSHVARPAEVDLKHTLFFASKDLRNHTDPYPPHRVTLGLFYTGIQQFELTWDNQEERSLSATFFYNIFDNQIWREKRAVVCLSVHASDKVSRALKCKIESDVPGMRGPLQ